ncbi:hypothetical protein NH340_JMT07189 [Sarcoptes scabiei]|nr:hypothetical protein NH340_JMT07189 [Sarcoptes scabiei]
MFACLPFLQAFLLSNRLFFLGFSLFLSFLCSDLLHSLFTCSNRMDPFYLSFDYMNSILPEQRIFVVTHLMLSFEPEAISLLRFSNNFFLILFCWSLIYLIELSSF